MNVKQCDRCGRLYEAHENILDNHEKPVNCLEICYDDGYSGFESYDIRAVVDLCPNCMKEFLGWLKPCTKCKLFDTVNCPGDELCKSKPAKPYFELKGLYL